MPTLKLFSSPYCGYCRRVLREAERLQVPLEVIDVWEQPEARERLYRERGRGTVPVLAIPDGGGERLLPESRDIIAFLRDHGDQYR